MECEHLSEVHRHIVNVVIRALIRDWHDQAQPVAHLSCKEQEHQDLKHTYATWHPCMSSDGCLAHLSCMLIICSMSWLLAIPSVSRECSTALNLRKSFPLSKKESVLINVMLDSYLMYSLTKVAKLCERIITGEIDVSKGVPRLHDQPNIILRLSNRARDEVKVALQRMCFLV